MNIMPKKLWQGNTWKDKFAIEIFLSTSTSQDGVRRSKEDTTTSVRRRNQSRTIRPYLELIFTRVHDARRGHTTVATSHTRSYVRRMRWHDSFRIDSFFFQAGSNGLAEYNTQTHRANKRDEILSLPFQTRPKRSRGACARKNLRKFMKKFKNRNLASNRRRDNYSSRRIFYWIRLQINVTRIVNIIT